MSLSSREIAVGTAERLCSSSPPGTGFQVQKQAISHYIRSQGGSVRRHLSTDSCSDFHSMVKKLFDEKVREVDFTIIRFIEQPHEFSRLCNSIARISGYKVLKFWQKYISEEQYNMLQSFSSNALQSPHSFSIEVYDVNNELNRKINQLRVSGEVECDFSGFSFVDRVVERLYKTIKRNSNLKTLIFAKSRLTDEQQQRLTRIRADLKEYRHLVVRDSEGGFIADAYENDYEHWESDVCGSEPPEGKRSDRVGSYEPRKTPRIGLEFYKNANGDYPQNVLEVGTGAGIPNALALALKGMSLHLVDANSGYRKAFFENLIKLVSLRNSSRDMEIPISFADDTIEVEKIEQIRKVVLNYWTSPEDKKTITVCYETELFTNCEMKLQFDFSISNYVWSERPPNQFDSFMKKFVRTVDLFGMVCGELYGSPSPVDKSSSVAEDFSLFSSDIEGREDENGSSFASTSVILPVVRARDDFTYHTPLQALTYFQGLKCKILYFEIESQEESLKRKDANLIAWGELYRIIAMKVPAVDDDMAVTISDILDFKKDKGEQQIYIHPDLEKDPRYSAIIINERERLKKGES